MKQLTKADEQIISDILKDFLKNEEVQKMKKYVQHGSITTYEHCMQVVRMSYLINKNFKLGANIKPLLIGAMLHDFFLYDWHDPGDGTHHLHGFSHSARAAINAKKFFGLHEHELHIIESHMWPLTITKYPRSKEAIIVCIADKCCSLKETLFMRKQKIDEKRTEFMNVGSELNFPKNDTDKKVDFE